MLYSRYLFRIRNMFVEYQDFSLNTQLSEIDTILIANNIAMNALYIDSLPIEMLSKDVYNAGNGISKFMNYAKLELTRLESEGKISDSNLILGNFNQVLLDHYEELSELNSRAIDHNVWLGRTLESFNTYLDDIGG